MLEHCDFVQQETVEGDTAACARPDREAAGGEAAGVDAKAPLAATWTRSSRRRRRRAGPHGAARRQLRNHVGQLARKAYWTSSSTPGVRGPVRPNEAVFSAAMEPDSFADGGRVLRGGCCSRLPHADRASCARPPSAAAGAAAQDAQEIAAPRPRSAQAAGGWATIFAKLAAGSPARRAYNDTVARSSAWSSRERCKLRDKAAPMDEELGAVAEVTSRRVRSSRPIRAAVAEDAN